MKQDLKHAPGKPLRIGAVAKQLGISPSTIRSWERIGLRFSAPVQPGTHRTYSAEDVRLLKRAIHLRRVKGLNATAVLAELQRDGFIDPDGDGSASRARPVGSRLRALRLKSKQSLIQVAKANQISVGFLSNLERSQTGASIGIMHRLARYYGTNILDFFSHTDSSGPLVRRKDRQSIHGWVGVQMDLLAWGDITMEPHLFHVAPGSGSKESYSHEGEEFLFVVRGRLNITLGEREYQLSKGDSFYFESRIVHRWLNPGKKTAIILWINTPPTF